MQIDKSLYDKASSFATANEITSIANNMGFKFT